MLESILSILGNNVTITHSWANLSGPRIKRSPQLFLDCFSIFFLKMDTRNVSALRRKENWQLQLNKNFPTYRTNRQNLGRFAWFFFLFCLLVLFCFLFFCQIKLCLCMCQEFFHNFWNIISILGSRAPNLASWIKNACRDYMRLYKKILLF